MHPIVDFLVTFTNLLFEHIVQMDDPPIQGRSARRTRGDSATAISRIYRQLATCSEERVYSSGGGCGADANPRVTIGLGAVTERLCEAARRCYDHVGKGTVANSAATIGSKHDERRCRRHR